jgi:hypothetical protein
MMQSVAIVLLSVSLAIAADDNKPGMMAVKDPVTGQLRAPNAQEAAKLTQAQPVVKRPTPHKQLKGPGGAVGMVLDDRSAIYTVATKNPNGTITIKETTDAKK